MKMKLKELVETQEALAKLLTKELEVKLAYRMRKIVGKITNELKHVENARMELLKKYGSKDAKNPARLQVPPEKIAAFTKEFNDLLDTEIDFGAEKIPFVCLEGAGKISPADLSLIEKLVEEPKPENEVKRPPVKGEAPSLE